MSLKVEIDEQATGFQILDYSDDYPEVCVCFSSRYDPDIEITLTISPEMFGEILVEAEGDDD